MGELLSKNQDLLFFSEHPIMMPPDFECGILVYSVERQKYILATINSQKQKVNMDIFRHMLICFQREDFYQTQIKNRIESTIKVDWLWVQL